MEEGEGGNEGALCCRREGEIMSDQSGSCNAAHQVGQILLCFRQFYIVKRCGVVSIVGMKVMS